MGARTEGRLRAAEWLLARVSGDFEAIARQGEPLTAPRALLPAPSLDDAKPLNAFNRHSLHVRPGSGTVLLNSGFWGMNFVVMPVLQWEYGYLVFWGAVVGIVEENDASAAQIKITEVNTGVIAAPARRLRASVR